MLLSASEEAQNPRSRVLLFPSPDGSLIEDTSDSMFVMSVCVMVDEDSDSSAIELISLSELVQQGAAVGSNRLSSRGAVVTW